jgi:iron complex outermembrane receptor protein
LALASPVLADDDRRSLNLPEGPLRQALFAFGEQFRVSVFFAEEHVTGLIAKSTQGHLTARDALEKLLGDACLEYEFVRERLVAITPGCTEPSEPVVAAAASDPVPAPGMPFIEEVLVRERYITGSRIRHPGFDQSMPVDVIDQTEILLSGYQALSEILRYQPAVSGNSTSTLISNGGDGTATVTLRGLPSSNTLVLLNGKRLNSDALYGRAVDLNTMPLAMVEEVQIVKDGVSAIYGSDAIAGVVNVITKRDFNGVKVEAYRGGASQGGLDTNRITLLGGHVSERWSVQFGANHYDQEGILSRDRRLSRSSDDRSRGGIDKRSSATVPSRLEFIDGPLILEEGATGTSPADFRPASEDDRFEFREFTSSVVPSRRNSYFGSIDWRPRENWTAFLEGLHTTTDAQSQLAPVPVFTGFETLDLTVSAENPYNPFGVDVSDVRRRISELPPRLQGNRSETNRWVAGFGYEGSRLNVNVALQSSVTEARERNRHGLHALRVQEALGSTCAATCVPLNLFGPPGSISDDMLDWIEASAAVTGTSRLRGGTIDVDARLMQLPAGTVEASAGVEYRLESLSTRPDSILAQGSLLGGANRGAVRGDRDIVEAFAETYIPLYRGQPWAHRLDIHLAARWSDYSDFGKTLNPRFLVNYEPVEDLVLRGSVARGFRAPTLLQLYGGESQSFEQLNDPCSSPLSLAAKIGCDVRSDPTLTQFLTINGGNPSLKPERSDTASFGFHWSRQLARHAVSISTDWYRIDQTDVVDSSAQFIVNRNADLLQFSERIFRDGNGNVTRVDATLQNIGEREVRGVDFRADWTLASARVGLFTLAFNATRILRFEDQFDPTSPTVDKAGTFNDEASGGLGALPDWKTNVGLSWQHAGWRGRYNVYRVSSLRETVPIVESRRTIDAWTTHNLNISYLGPLTAWFRFTAGINNVFDEAPPFAAAAFNDSYDGRTYDITGRYIYASIDKSF